MPLAYVNARFDPTSVSPFDAAKPEKIDAMLVLSGRDIVANAPYAFVPEIDILEPESDIVTPLLAVLCTLRLGKGSTIATPPANADVATRPKEFDAAIENADPVIGVVVDGTTIYEFDVELDSVHPDGSAPAETPTHRTVPLWGCRPSEKIPEPGADGPTAPAMIQPLAEFDIEMPPDGW